MQRGRLGGIPLPRTFPIRDGGIGSMMVFACGYSRESGNGLAVPSVCYYAGVRPTPPSPPEGPPPRAR